MDVSVQFVWKAPEHLEKVHWKFHWWHACISMVPAQYPYSVSVMSCSQCVGWHTFCLSTLYFWPYVEFIRTQTEHVRPGHVRAKLCYKWVYAAVIYSNETFLNIFSSFYPKAHKVITLVMTQPWVSETIKRVSDWLSFFIHNEWAPLVPCPDVPCHSRLYGCRGAERPHSGSDLYWMAAVVGVIPAPAEGLEDVSDGTIACVPEGMPGFICTAILLNICESVSRDLLFSCESVSEILISWLVWYVQEK